VGNGVRLVFGRFGGSEKKRGRGSQFSETEPSQKKSWEGERERAEGKGKKTFMLGGEEGNSQKRGVEIRRSGKSGKTHRIKVRGPKKEIKRNSLGTVGGAKKKGVTKFTTSSKSIGG